MREVIRDVDALDTLIANGRIESNVRRVGAEQEMVLVDSDARPAAVGLDVIRRAQDPRLTTELGLYNVEGNAQPHALRGDGLARLHSEIDDLVDRVGDAAALSGARVLLAGIAPTLRYRDVTREMMTPEDRYKELDASLRELRRGPFQVHIRGVDELDIVSESVMMEACNTSFQFHLQVSAEEFAPMYNAAQWITAALVGIAANAPILFGKRLWSETRIGVFEQSVDDRLAQDRRLSRRGRVSFGSDWVHSSITELFRDDIMRIRPAITFVPDAGDEHIEDPDAPELRALRIHNGTIYRWNRPCFGVADGIAHLRIENRVIPAGPTTLDEMANGAFFAGATLGVGQTIPDLAKRLSFGRAKENFLAAAQHGIAATITGLDGRPASLTDVITRELVPLAREALSGAGVEPGLVARYLDVIEERARARQNGASWMIAVSDRIDERVSPVRRARAITHLLLDRAESGEPVGTWSVPAESEVEGAGYSNPVRVSEIMSHDVWSVRAGDPVELVECIMRWRGFRHVLVEGEDGSSLGVVSRAACDAAGPGRDWTAADLVQRPVIEMEGDTPVNLALERLHAEKADCILVMDDGVRIGIATLADFRCPAGAPSNAG